MPAENFHLPVLGIYRSSWSRPLIEYRQSLASSYRSFPWQSLNLWFQAFMSSDLYISLNSSSQSYLLENLIHLPCIFPTSLEVITCSDQAMYTLFLLPCLCCPPFSCPKPRVSCLTFSPAHGVSHCLPLTRPSHPRHVRSPWSCLLITLPEWWLITGCRQNSLEFSLPWFYQMWGVPRYLLWSAKHARSSPNGVQMDQPHWNVSIWLESSFSRGKCTHLHLDLLPGNRKAYVWICWGFRAVSGEVCLLAKVFAGRHADIYLKSERRITPWRQGRLITTEHVQLHVSPRSSHSTHSRLPYWWSV